MKRISFCFLKFFYQKYCCVEKVHLVFNVCATEINLFGCLSATENHLTKVFFFSQTSVLNLLFIADLIFFVLIFVTFPRKLVSLSVLPLLLFFLFVRFSRTKKKQQQNRSHIFFTVFFVFFFRQHLHFYLSDFNPVSISPPKTLKNVTRWSRYVV